MKRKVIWHQIFIYVSIICKILSFFLAEVNWNFISIACFCFIYFTELYYFQCKKFIYNNSRKLIKSWYSKCSVKILVENKGAFISFTRQSRKSFNSPFFSKLFRSMDINTRKGSLNKIKRRRWTYHQLLLVISYM